MKKQEFYDRHLYLEDPEVCFIFMTHKQYLIFLIQDLTEEFANPLILPELGFRVELGGSLTKPEIPVLEEVEKHSPYYKDNFCNKGNLIRASSKSI